MKKQLVWDIPVRLFHWLLVLSLCAQWLTAEILEDAMDIHFYFGYLTLGLIIFRLIWGVIGTKYAKFSNFISGPKAMLTYLKMLRNKQHNPTVGHNPIGGLMLPAVLIIVGLQAVSGLFISDDIVSSGPYYDSASKNLQDCMQWLHHNLFNILLGLIVTHIIAIAGYRLGLKHDLISAMFTGKKAVQVKDSIPHSDILKAILVMCLVAVFVYWLVEINPPPIEEYYY